MPWAYSNHTLQRYIDGAVVEVPPKSVVNLETAEFTDLLKLKAVRGATAEELKAAGITVTTAPESKTVKAT